MPWEDRFFAARSRLCGEQKSRSTRQLREGSAPAATHRQTRDSASHIREVCRYSPCAIGACLLKPASSRFGLRCLALARIAWKKIVLVVGHGPLLLDISQTRFSFPCIARIFMPEAEDRPPSCTLSSTGRLQEPNANVPLRWVSDS
jgi:hypothetical protein